MKISIKDFRCFHETTPIEVRPINILVGENSAGKTSFLAAARFLFDLLDRGTRASFNKDPFHLGSYENIAHYRGGRFGRAQSFGFQVQSHTRSRPLRPRPPGLFPNQETQSPRPYKLDVQFVDRKSQPALSFVSFDAGDYAFEISFADGRPLCLMRTPSMEAYEFDAEPFMLRDDTVSIDLSFIELLLRSMSFRRAREPREEAGRQPPAQELEDLYDLYFHALRQLPRNVYASAPVRSRPERTYNPTDFTTAPDGAHMPFVLAQLNYFEPAKWGAIRETLREFGETSGLFDDVSVKKVGSSTGGPFQIIVNMSNRKSNIIDVGYGVSQALPIITDVLRAEKGSMFLFQQPEVHLHPKAQAELGTFFTQIAKQRKHTFFVETHSDHLIDRIRTHVRDGNDIRTSDVSILYFERKGHDVSIHSISIDKQGNLIEAPPSYRSFFLEEEMRSLGVRIRNAPNN